MELRRRVRQAYRAYCRHKKWQRFVQIMAMVVVFCTTYALILPAITMETETICGMTEHTHTDACYGPAATVSPKLHYHGDTCYKKTLICELEETEAHGHTEDCQGVIETLVCEDMSEEHKHQATCYTYETGLTCGQEETEGHAHSDDCYQSDLICGLDEGSVVTEDAAEEGEENTVLVCGLDEHTHDESCYPVSETETPEATEMPDSTEVPEPTETPTGDPTADVETQEDWEASLSSIVLTGEQADDLISVAKSQLGYTESSLNFIYDDNGELQAYTRYGQWYGSRYAPWSGMFVSFCLYYAQIDGIPAEQDCQTWLETLNAAELYRTAAQYSPVAGDLIFLDCDLDTVCDHTALVEAVTYAEDGSTTSLQIIVGDWDGRVERAELLAGDSSLLGYVPLSEVPENSEESDKPQFTYTGEDVSHAQVTVGVDSSVPEDAALNVGAISETDEEYITCAELIEALVDEDILSMTLWDISFYDAAGEYLSVSDTAQVTLTLDGDVFGGNEVKLFHFVDGAPVELEYVTVSCETVTAEDGTESVQTVLSFETDGFSLFAAVGVYSDYERVTGLDASELAGSYYIVSYTGNYTMNAVSNGSNGLTKSAFGTEEHTLWTITETDTDGSYYLSAEVNGQTYYLTMGTSGNMGLGTEKDSAGVFEATIKDDTVLFLCNSNYINHYGGDPGTVGFTGYSQGDGGSQLRLYIKRTSWPDDAVTVNNLDGQSFAIVNEATGQAMLSTAYNGTSLSESAVTVSTVDGTNYFQGDNITLWTFDASAASAGQYYIYTAVGDATQYLSLSRTTLRLVNAITEASVFTVLSMGDGKVLLRVGDYYINEHGSEVYFAGWNGTGANSQQTLCLPIEKDSGFTITYGTYTITLQLQDAAGKPLTGYGIDRVLEVGSEDAGAALRFSNLAPEIDGYEYSHAYFVDNGTYTVVSVGPNSTDGYRLYEQAYYDGTTTKFYSRSKNLTVYLVYDDEKTRLYYNVNLPGGDWIDSLGNAVTPAVAQSQVITTEAGNIYTVSGRDTAVGVFIRNTLASRGTEKTYCTAYNTTLKTAGTLSRETYLPPGAEYEFLGWQTTNTAGETCLIPENAAVVLDETTGKIRVTDVSGAQQTLDPGATLTGQWQMVSNVILFFVNHGDTMLEHETTHPIRSTDSSYYTDAAAIGHIYNIDSMIDDNGVINPDLYAASQIDIQTDAAITGMFQPVYDPDNPAPQIVIDAVKKFDTSNNAYYEAAPNYTDALTDAAITEYIHSQTGKQILLDGAVLDPEDINSDNYMLYWYAMKLVSNDSYAYHADGVLVARTQKMEIYKTFSGLERSQVIKTDGDGNITGGIISTMSFPLYLLRDTTDNGTVMDVYTTMDAASSQDGVYSYDGPQSASSNIFKWTLESVQGQRYAFEEAGYTLDGYDCSSLVSVHYKDGTVKYAYKTDATWSGGTAVNKKDDTTTTDVDESTIVDYYNGVKDLYVDNPLVGGKVESVIFANFYTKTGTGAFSISKVAAADETVRLAGAVFQLSQGNTVIQTVTTNENGAAHFSNLEAGTYTLKETTAPTGYQKLDTTWTVVVAKGDSDNVTVTVAGTKVYNRNNGGIQSVYLIENEPVDTTMTVNKTFTTITEAQVAQLTNYCIEVQKSDGTVVQTLTLDEATPITGTMNGYTWTLTGIEKGDYKLVEKNYLHDSYLDTVVTATVNGTAVSAEKSSDNTVATIPVIKSDKADTVNITNDYTNTFRLKIVKVDATGNNAPMSGVVFNIYGEYGEGGGEAITYKDAQGNEHTVYYVGTTDSTDANGVTWYNDMKLSSDGRSFLYVVDEVETPAGYVKLSEPIVQVIYVDNEHYTDGVYTLTVENFKPNLATVTIKAEKEWNVPEDMDVPDAVNVSLYRKTVNNDGSDGDVTLVGTVQLNSSNNWTYTWSNLDYAVSVRRYEYYVAETALPGFSTHYSTYTETLSVGTETVTAAKALGEELNRSVTITNSSGYQLPASGGRGTRWFALLGLMLMMPAALWLPWPRARAGPMKTPGSRGAPPGTGLFRSLASGPGRRKRGGGDSS